MIVAGDHLKLLLAMGWEEIIVQHDPPEAGTVEWVRRSPLAIPECRAVVVASWPLSDGGFAVVLERVPEYVRPPRKPSDGPRLRLTRAQRKGLFAGEAPEIEGVGRSPVREGETVRLSSKVSLTVLRITFPQRHDGQMGWKLHYELIDGRDTAHLLRRTPPAHRAGDELDIQDQGALRVAAEQSFYTSTPRSAMRDAGEAPDRKWVEVRTKTQREFDHQRRLAKHAEKLKERDRARRKRAA